MTAASRPFAGVTFTTVTAVLMSLSIVGSQSAQAVGVTSPCDFDNDGYGDVAVGARGDSPQGVAQAGSIQVIYGTSSGLDAIGNEVWHRGKSDVAGELGEEDRFGGALACGDLNGDGYSDLAVGVSSDDVQGRTAAGSVHVFYGSSLGLSADGDHIVDRQTPGINGNARRLDGFGAALAIGDFDGDGFGDLAVGVPSDDIDEIPAAGSVQIVYGTAGGLTAERNEIWHRDRGGINSANESFNFFGSSLASGDIDGDGRDDLAIGVPGDFVGQVANAGSVHIMFGTAQGLDSSGDQIWHRDRSGINGVAEGSSFFGRSVALGDFDNDGFEDLAAGAPSADLLGIHDAGSVNIIYGSADGLTSDNDQLWHRDRAGMNGQARENDGFGNTLAVGDFNGDDHSDLAIGVIFDSVHGQQRAGSVSIIHGASEGLTSSGDVVLDQDKPFVEDSAEQGDFFSAVLTANDYDGDGYSDLAVGVPSENVAAVDSAGAMNAFFGAASGLATTDSDFWHRGVDGILGSLGVDDRFGGGLS